MWAGGVFHGDQSEQFSRYGLICKGAPTSPQKSLPHSKCPVCSGTLWAYPESADFMLLSHCPKFWRGGYRTGQRTDLGAAPKKCSSFGLIAPGAGPGAQIKVHLLKIQYSTRRKNGMPAASLRRPEQILRRLRQFSGWRKFRRPNPSRPIARRSS